ncbi:AraC family transcriptional regulator [Salipaludibacillus sp. LMS25]|uniref:helix-turn-helix transcriptional regulator n=1 Tax=Salipaludibacillus sp. LMS25 TaxID=2924031 RepID=UPI0020D0700C|nr:AraC family transcriptional regulator [Salipaludibacillus sp. LMS25]UTR13773.1 AraC family transcriptional regulator [Salipaludibacillus sp. LMS25]
MYSELTKNVVNFLEEFLLDDWQLEDYASKVGYSKFHLSRIFKEETGLTISEYIRKRRLATGAMYLLYSDESIIQIAFDLHFQSQEAFTRSFKELYKLPPGKYRKLMRSLRGMEETNMTETIKGWILSGSHPTCYEMKTDGQVFHTGTKSGLLTSKTKVSEEQFGTMMQSFSAGKWKGKRIKVSCFLKTEDVQKCGIWCRVDNNSGDVIQFDNMDNRSIQGTTDWNFYSIVLDVPEESSSIHFGILLTGTGKVWADGFKFDEVDLSVSSTNMLEKNELPLEPLNLGFDER